MVLLFYNLPFILDCLWASFFFFLWAVDGSPDGTLFRSPTIGGFL